MGGSVGGITDSLNSLFDPIDLHRGQAKRQKKENDAKQQAAQQQQLAGASKTQDTVGVTNKKTGIIPKTNIQI